MAKPKSSSKSSAKSRAAVDDATNDTNNVDTNTMAGGTATKTVGGDAKGAGTLVSPMQYPVPAVYGGESLHNDYIITL